MTSDQPSATLTAPPTAAAPAVAAPPPAALDRRSLAPDLARGMLLLFIALANVWGYLWSTGESGPGGRPAGGSDVDHLVDALTAFFVDDRSRPMFAILYGFGLATMASRLAARGADRRGARRVLARRGAWLVVLGLVHSALLFGGDILAAYGVTGLVALAFLHRSRVTLWIWFAAGTLLSTAAGVVVLVFFEEGFGGDGTPTTSYVASAGERLVSSGASIGLAVVLLFFVPQVVLGILLSRAGWLTRPWEHRRRLGQVVVVALAVNVVGNLPWALVVGHVWEPSATVGGVLEIVHIASGVVMGLGYVCLFGWLAAVWHDRRDLPVVRAVTAVGERSLTSYLLQSVMLAPLLSAWGLGLGGRIGTATAAALAVTVWLVTVAVAVALDRTGRRGPAEVLLRRLTYGRRARSAA
ncbi:DUF418 domain-containing protein [Cellulomonas sp. H30R-01]|uniref:DUF418 domain-containing protein n=1 Tax=Cellulomonas sp. H30R-01 TaxID=2704467 RepID=UPI00138B5A91|nr:DUF418 domain-containing protein [Cellulomonas sp. H30R-01]QHT57669.1 DUF418 domain-containing protein [Cellulomonas sp. H30R-01]